ncbi:porin [Neisseriaceae bacterium TC5R-5]|nr:porin [Neisseriaceae bacterium TC5R-5]
MQKKTLATLLATLFILPVAAQADVQVYGFMSGGIESAKATGAPSGSEYDSRARIVDNNSRIGFKGWEDLGNGTKAIWQVESSLRNFEQGGTDDRGRTATLGTRNTFIGIDNADFGRVLLGQNDSAYKLFTGGGSKIGTDIMPSTTAENFGSNSVASRGEARYSNSLHYFSPTWSGFSFGASWQVDEARTRDVNKEQTDAKRLSLGAAYKWQGLTLGTSWDRRYDSGVNADSTTIASTSKAATSGNSITFYSVAASYKFDTGTFIGANYEWGRFDQVTGAGQLKQDDWVVAIGQDFGAASIKLSYAELGRLKDVSSGINGDDFKAKQWVLGATYDLSKQTQLYAYATKITNDDKQNANFANNPVYDSGTSLTPGNSPQAFGVGMKLSF